MTRTILSSLLVLGLVGCAQGQKKADAPATDAKAADAKTAPKADAKDAKAAKGKEMKDAKTAAKPATEAAPAAGTIECSSGGDKRTIAVKAVDKGCEVVYEKNGATTSPGSGQNGMSNCNRIQEKIKTNLVNAGFKCT